VETADESVTGSVFLLRPDVTTLVQVSALGLEGFPPDVSARDILRPAPCGGTLQGTAPG
jgi:hypothetical protein